MTTNSSCATVQEEEDLDNYFFLSSSIGPMQHHSIQTFTYISHMQACTFIYGMKIASRLIHQKSHVSLKSPYLFIQEFAPSLNLTIYFKYLISTEKEKKSLLVTNSILFMFEFSTHVFLSLKCPGLLHCIHFCLHMQCTRSVLKPRYLGYCLITVSKI